MAATIAYLDSKDNYTSFTFGQNRIRFETPASLIKYLTVKYWNQGYLVVDALYQQPLGVTEEYIDLIPICNNLYIDPQEAFKDIKEVQIRHE